jgi:hypothetical protein
MTIEELKGDLGRLQGDAAQLGRDSRTLVKDFGKQVETVEDEIVAAEYLASTSTAESLGALIDSAIRFRNVGREQIKFCIDDGRETIEQLQVADSGGDYIDTLFGHVGRRFDHLTAGFESGWRIAENELDKIIDSADVSWNLFSDLVSSDWSQPVKKTSEK